MKVSAARPKVTLFGNFGTGNLGNDATLRAVVCNLRRLMPGVDIRCVCPVRSGTVLDNDIVTVPMRAPLPIWKARSRARQTVHDPTAVGQNTQTGRYSSVLSACREWTRACLFPILELYRWFKSIETLRDCDVLVMTGTGMLGDYAIRPLGLHYDIFRWIVSAKLCRCKVLFASVGGGPIRHPLSRIFVKASIALANYRSYRDSVSRQCLDAMGCAVRNDPVMPDLAFSMLAPRQGASDRAIDRKLVVGVGLMNYHDRLGRSATTDKAYRDYIARIASLVVQLCDHAYCVRILIGDVVWDPPVIRDLRTELTERGMQEWDSRISDNPAQSVDELVDQLSSVDVVVSSRYHNLVLALTLSKPVIAISYHEKFLPLMQSMAMDDCYQDIENINIDVLLGKLGMIADNIDTLHEQIARRVACGRRALEEQYRHIAAVTLGGDCESKGHFIAAW